MKSFEEAQNKAIMRVMLKMDNIISWLDNIIPWWTISDDVELIISTLERGEIGWKEKPNNKTKSSTNRAGLKPKLT